MLRHLCKRGPRYTDREIDRTCNQYRNDYDTKYPINLDLIAEAQKRKRNNEKYIDNNDNDQNNYKNQRTPSQLCLITVHVFVVVFLM